MLKYGVLEAHRIEICLISEPDNDEPYGQATANDDDGDDDEAGVDGPREKPNIELSSKPGLHLYICFSPKMKF